jgi:hypothetical protein
MTGRIDKHKLIHDPHHVLYREKLVGYARRHRWGEAQRLVNADEVVMHEVDGNRVAVVLDLLGKGIR